MAKPVYARPAATEYAAFYAGYIAGVPDGDLLQILSAQRHETAELLERLPEERGNYAYAPGKWALKEVVGHIADAERVFSYRALRFARGDETELAGFDENKWVPQSGATARTLSDLAGELGQVRGATLSLLAHLPADVVMRRGTANGNPVTVRAIAWIIAGHERHHLRILRERYLT
jgi:hypothetical protein